MFDRDGSGEIELDEIARAFKTTGKLTDETRAQLKAHFDFMDSDGSGTLMYIMRAMLQSIYHGRRVRCPTFELLQDACLMSLAIPSQQQRANKT